MVARDNDPLHAAIHARLAQLVASATTPPRWQQAWARLEPTSTEAERLAVYQAVRDAGSVPAAASFYLIAWQIDVLSMGPIEKALRGHEERLEAIRRKHGLDQNVPWVPGAGPSDYEAARRELHAAWDALYAAQLEAFGETALARLFRADREQFDRLREQGRQFFHGRPGEQLPEEDFVGGLWECHRHARSSRSTGSTRGP